MKMSTEDMTFISDSFEKMKTRRDFVDLLNVVKLMIFGNSAKPFTLRQLTYHAFMPEGKRYARFTISKKDGRQRIIYAPLGGLKVIQKTLAVLLQVVFQPHAAATGFTKNKSIVNNAREHVKSNYVFNIDLKDFFPSINQARIWTCLQLKPLNLIGGLTEQDLVKDIFRFSQLHRVTDNEGKQTGYDALGHKYVQLRDDTAKMEQNVFVLGEFVPEKNFYKIRSVAATQDSIIEQGVDYINNVYLKKEGRLGIANLIASLSCIALPVEGNTSLSDTMRRNVLAQGAPTSPVISNIVCQRLDRLLSGVGNRFGLRYTRYADDITFSSNHNVYKKDGEFMQELRRILTEQGFEINENKTRLQKRGYQQVVTGLLVNQKVNLKKQYVKELRMWLYYWERYGYEQARTFFRDKNIKPEMIMTRRRVDFRKIIASKIEFLKMVKGSHEIYQQLKKRFDRLNRDERFIEKVLQVWEKDGVDKARLQYSK